MTSTCPARLPTRQTATRLLTPTLLALVGATTALGAGPREFQSLVERGDFAALARELGTSLAAAGAGDDAQVQAALADPDRLTALVQREIIRQCTPEALGKLAARDRGREFLLEFLRSPEWMESFLLSGPPDVSFDQALDNLRVLWSRGTNLDQPLYRRLATAMALSGGTVNQRRLLDRFEHVQEAHRGLLLHAEFDRLDVRELRWTVHLESNRADYQFLLDDLQTNIPGYFGACWAVMYRDTNDFGGTIYGPNFHRPWWHAYGIGQQTVRAAGAVCGNLSIYGSIVARVHGVLARSVGQPGHNAYSIRVGDSWPMAYSIDWPNKTSTPGWSGTAYATFHRLSERVYGDREAFARATRLLWAARLRAEQHQTGVRILPGVRYAIYAEGVPSIERMWGFLDLEPTLTGTTDRIRLSDLVNEHRHLLRVNGKDEHGKRLGFVWEAELEVSGTSGIVITNTGKWAAPRISIDGKPIVLTAAGRGTAEPIVPLPADLVLPPDNGASTRAVHRIPLPPGRHALRLELFTRPGYVRHDLEVNGALVKGDWIDGYRQAIAAQPLNYPVWLEYVAALEQTVDLPASAYAEAAVDAARAFTSCPEAGWAILDRLLGAARKGLDPSRRLALLVECHGHLTQAGADRFERFPLDHFLDRQARFLGAADQELPFFEQLLRIHHAPPPADGIFGQVMAWGQKRFARNPQTAAGFAVSLGNFFRSQGAGVNAKLVREQVQAGIRNAGAAADLQSFRLWSDMAESLLPALTPADVQLKAAQAKAFPTREAFPGVVLSRDALLAVPHPFRNDRPESHRRLLSESPWGGLLEVAAVSAPAVVVRLPNACDISGLVVVGRYENPAEAERSLPMRVSVSEDGTTWTPVATFDTVEPAYRVDLTKAPARAAHVKIERLPGKTDRFPLRSILVYGKKLF